LSQVLRQLPALRDPNLLVGAATSDDAGVYRIDRHRALVQTVDFFTPIVDDPIRYGQIAAANALSDVYAMGGRPLTAMNIMGVPTDVIPPKIIHAILRGGSLTVKKAGCVLVGGHTIRNPEPIYGLSVTGLVSPKRMLTNAAARPGDVLLLTKPLGTGIVTTGIKRNLTSASLARRTIAVMSTLNSVGVEIAERGLARAATDITGFGLLGHLASLCRASHVGAELHASKFPALGQEVWELIRQECVPGGTKQNLSAAEPMVSWRGVAPAWRLLLADAQTSGGLLLCVRPRDVTNVLRILRRHRTPAQAIVGQIVRSSRPRIVVTE
jgi:selenide,water dikinase